MSLKKGHVLFLAHHKISDQEPNPEPLFSLSFQEIFAQK